MVAVALLSFYFFVDPDSSRWMPKCTFHQLTGWQCPGCGSQRALHALLHGDFSAAWGFNPFIFFIVPAAVALGAIEALRMRFPRLYSAVYRPATFIIILILIIGWTIARNLLEI